MTKILVVEEDDGVRKIMIDVLRANPGCEYEIFEANDGGGGLELIEAINFDLVLTDWRMREMNGDRMIARAKEIGRLPQRVIVVTGADLEECWLCFSQIISPMLHVGFYLQSLPKPFSIDHLQGTVMRALAWQPSL